MCWVSGLPTVGASARLDRTRQVSRSTRRGGRSRNVARRDSCWARRQLELPWLCGGGSTTSAGYSLCASWCECSWRMVRRNQDSQPSCRKFEGYNGPMRTTWALAIAFVVAACDYGVSVSPGNAIAVGTTWHVEVADDCADD